MAKRRTRRLVIDADVLQSAGESEHPVSSACRSYLMTVLSVGHHIVMTEAIQEEWRRHRSTYSRKWLTQMWGRKRIYRVEGERDVTLREQAERVLPDDQREDVVHDIHLIEAAIATDRLVSSRDETARRVFKIASNDIRVIVEIVWVNPTRACEEPIEWLRNGARAESHRRLGS